MGIDQYPMSTMHSRINFSRLNSSPDADDPETLLDYSERHSPLARYRPSLLAQKMSRRHLLLVLSVVFLMFIFSSLMYKTRTHESQLDVPLSTPDEKVGEFEYPSAVIGPPTAKFRDNLNLDLKYITSWTDAGWTNDVITYINLVYLGVMTQRIPILGSFMPSHVKRTAPTAPPIDFSKVFDLPRLSKLINLTILEWHEVKDRNSTEVDELGCWDIWSSVEMRVGHPRAGSEQLGPLNIDVSYTQAPAWVKAVPNYEPDRHCSLGAVVSLASPEMRLESIADPQTTKSHLNHVRLPPDEHVLCYDFVYYVTSHVPYEFEYEYNPAWKFVGQHMHWNRELEKLANRYVRRAMNLRSSDEAPPPYVSIHIRHRDFGDQCNGRPLSECYASLDVIERRVKEVQQELRERKNLDVKYVVMTSDETNSTWWDDVKQRGWYSIDHSQTAKVYGYWYPVFIDAVIQSNGHGFVGTDSSTMSTIARKRVASWYDGAVRTVKWGNPNSDDH